MRTQEIFEALNTRPAKVKVLDAETFEPLREFTVENRATALALTPEPGTSHVVSVYVMDLLDA